MSLLEPIAYKARWVLPIASPPLEDGLVTVCNGQIVEVGKSTSASRVINLGDATIMPGLVNAHTHLEFSDLSQPLGRARQSFPDWILEVVAHRRALATNVDLSTHREKAILQGLRASQLVGTAVIGEIASPPCSAEAFATSAGAGVIFLELLGLAAERINPLLQLAREHLTATYFTKKESLSWQPGLSPHAPYTVHPQLLEQLCKLSAAEHVPVAMHLAESFEELELLASHSGRFVDVLETLQAWRPDCLPRGIRPFDYLPMLAQAERSLVIHGNCFVAEEIDFLAREREKMSVVYCPRTHAYFHAGDHPLRAMLAAGVRVAVGTDSLASNPDLSVWEELRFVRNKYPDLTDQAILQLGTQAAAEALGLETHFGTLSPGKQAALTVVATDRSTSLWQAKIAPLPFAV